MYASIYTEYRWVLSHLVSLAVEQIHKEETSANKTKGERIR